MRHSLMLLLCLAVIPAAQAFRSNTNPLAKVMQLMDDLVAKITKEGEAEAKAYKEFFEWCDEAARDKDFEIETATALKAKLEATIAKTTADADAADDKIEELVASLAQDDADLKNATSIREREASDFAKSEKELMDTIDTIARALSILEREMAKNPAAFAQMDFSNVQSLVSSLGSIVDAAGFPTADKKKLMAFIQSKQANQEDDDQEPGAPEASVYKSHSSGIVDLLEDLKEKAEEDLAALRKAENNAKHAYNMLKQSLEDQMKADNKDLADEKASKASAEEAKATATGDLSTTNKELADAKASLQKTKEDCMETAANHEATVNGRTEELKVIATAKKILSESTSGAVSQSYSLLQVERSRMMSRSDLAGAEVLTAVRNLAKKQHSEALVELASRIGAVLKLGSTMGEDPFVKVKGLITDLIAKLEKEMGDEAEEKAYCDDQMAKTEEKKGELEEDSSKLAAKIDKAESQSARLKEEVKELQSELAALAKLQAEMDKIRQETHADFVQAKSDLEAGLVGVRKALGVLRDYYGGGASMMQMMQPPMPESHSKASGAGSSIIGILEVCESDFAKSLAKEESQEEDAQSEYDETTQANKVTRTTKEQDVKYKTKEFNGLDKQIADLTGDKDTIDTQLKAVLEYYEKVKDRCIAKPETYEARKARRDAEIAGLKEALTILQDETAFVQQGRSSSHHLLMADQ